MIRFSKTEKFHEIQKNSMKFRNSAFMGISSKLLSVFILMAAAQPAMACRAYTYKMSAKEADIILTGTVEKITDLIKSHGVKQSDVTFSVTRVLKGTVPKTIVIRDMGQCRNIPNFQKKSDSANEYLVFAVQKNGRYETSAMRLNTLAADKSA
jgi:hypothetical protein